MSIALPEQLNFEWLMPLSGRAKQKMAIALPITGAGSYQLGSTFVINIPHCSEDTVFDPYNSFLYFNVYNLDGTGVLMWDHSVNSLIKKWMYCMPESSSNQLIAMVSSRVLCSIAKWSKAHASLVWILHNEQVQLSINLVLAKHSQLLAIGFTASP